MADTLTYFDNIDFAVLSRIQALSERFGLKPYDFVATLDHSKNEPILGMGVKFQNMADGPEPDKRVSKCLMPLELTKPAASCRAVRRRSSTLSTTLCRLHQPRTRR